MIRELRAGRTLTTAQSEKVSALEDRLAQELKNSASLERSYDSAVREINSLRTALDFAQVAIDSQKETITELKGQRDKARESASTANKRSALVIAGAALFAALKIFVF